MASFTNNFYHTIYESMKLQLCKSLHSKITNKKKSIILPSSGHNSMGLTAVRRTGFIAVSPNITEAWFHYNSWSSCPTKLIAHYQLPLITKLLTAIKILND